MAYQHSLSQSRRNVSRSISSVTDGVDWVYGFGYPGTGYWVGGRYEKAVATPNITAQLNVWVFAPAMNGGQDISNALGLAFGAPLTVGPLLHAQTMNFVAVAGRQEFVSLGDNLNRIIPNIDDYEGDLIVVAKFGPGIENPDVTVALTLVTAN